jgi:hypothetical protein
LAVEREALQLKKEDDKFPHRFAPGTSIWSLEELRLHSWVYVMNRHKAQHVLSLMNCQVWYLLQMLSTGKIREALEMTDQEVINEKNIGNRAAYLARIEYRERLFDHACAIHDSVAGVSEDNGYLIVDDGAGGCRKG